MSKEPRNTLAVALTYDAPRAPRVVASGRGVAALPRWLAEEYAKKSDVAAVRLGPKGIAKQIFLGAREADLDIDYLKAFIAMAAQSRSG